MMYQNKDISEKSKVWPINDISIETKICLSNANYNLFMMYLSKHMIEQWKVRPINNVSKQRYVLIMKSTTP